jgi:hypothetical protein
MNNTNTGSKIKKNKKRHNQLIISLENGCGLLVLYLCVDYKSGWPLVNFGLLLPVVLIAYILDVIHC